MAAASSPTPPVEFYLPELGRWYQLTAYPLPVGTAYLLVDSTLPKQAEQAVQLSLARANQRNLALLKTNATLDTLVHIAAHDLQGPVNNLTQLLEIAAADNYASVQTMAQQEVQKLARTLHGLVRLLRTQHQVLDEVRALSLAEVYQTVASELAGTLPAEHGLLTVDFSAAPTIVYIEAYLVSILKNLLHNAAKYRSPERALQLRVCTERQDDHVVLLVQDNGLGIDLARHEARLFEPFARLTTQAAGHRLGPHLVNTMVGQNGGRIEVTSTLGQGTTFRVWLREYPPLAASVSA